MHCDLSRSMTYSINAVVCDSMPSLPINAVIAIPTFFMSGEAIPLYYAAGPIGIWQYTVEIASSPFRKRLTLPSSQ